MIARVLPSDEWAKLEGTDIAAALPYHHPSDVTVIVVEDEGNIVGAWAVLRVVQLEGLWIAPSHRKRVSVARPLLEKTIDVARQQAKSFAFTGSTTPDVTALLERHLDAKKLPMESFVIPLGVPTCL